jgi:hypothetical protein
LFLLDEGGCALLLLLETKDVFDVSALGEDAELRDGLAHHLDLFGYLGGVELAVKGALLGRLVVYK